MICGDDQNVAADGLVVGDGFFDLVGGDFFDGGVGARCDQAVFIEPSLYVFGIVAKKAGKFHFLVAELCHCGKCAFEIVFGDVAQTEHLQSVLCHNKVSLS